MRRILFLLLALLTIAFPPAARAQTFQQFSVCNVPPRVLVPGTAALIGVDLNGNLCITGAINVVIPPVNVSTPNVQIATPLVVSLANTPGVTQSTSPWIVSGTVLQGNPPWTVTVTPAISVTIPPVQIATPLQVGLVNTPGVTQATSPWVVSGTVLQGTSPWVVSANSISPVQGTVTSLQGTSPWVVSANSLSPIFGTVTALQGTSPWTVGTHSVNQGTSPWIVSGTALQGTSPWVVSSNSISPIQGSVIAYQGTSPWNVNSSPISIATPLQVGLVNTPGVTQATSPWIVSGTVLQGTSPWTVTGSITVPPVQIATPLSINIPQQGAVVSGAYADGAQFSIGSVADAIYNGSGSATVISALKGIYAAIKAISVTANVSIPTPLVVSLANTPGVTQATTPWIVQGNGPNTQVLAVTVTPSITASVNIPTPLVVSLANTPGVTQSTSPWIVSGTSLQGTSPWVVSGTVLQGTSPWVVSASTLQGIFGSATTYQGTSPWVVSASTLQGVFGSATVYQGTSPWAVNGTVTVSANSVSPIQGSVISYQGTSPYIVSGTVLQGTTPWSVSQSTSPWIVSGTVLQGTSPWVVSANSISPIQGTVVALQGTSPWNVNSSPVTIATPLVVSIANTPGVTQSTSPWIVSGTVLQGANPWFTQEVPGGSTRVNPLVAAQWGIGAEGAAAIATAVQVAGTASSTEAPTQSANTISAFFTDLVGKLITSPYSNRENMVRGGSALNGNAATSILPSPGGGLKNYITDLNCTRSDAGTTAITVSTNDVSQTTTTAVFALPNTGGGGGFVKTFNVPLVVAANTAFQVQASAPIAFIYCNAQGFKGY